MASELTVSLEPHLSEALSPLTPILPPDLGAKLSLELSRPEIHYAVLSEISKWSRTDTGRDALQSQNLEPNSYSMISLLAGTVTSPSSNLPPYTPPESAQQAAARELDDRKALTAIVNALLSIGGSGAAAWWAAGKTGWRDEWKALLSLGVAATVAVSETVLYIIWQSRRLEKSKRRRARTLGREKKQDGDNEAVIDARVTDIDSNGIRRRTLTAKIDK